ncbi:hypothetical protein C8Q80DRAFT_702967 [Daedaleopsis nitida]|nr:hypothetical protein C8Q80DRAFT_702967 [Daedaleopsis nitida]
MPCGETVRARSVTFFITRRSPARVGGYRALADVELKRTVTVRLRSSLRGDDPGTGAPNCLSLMGMPYTPAHAASAESLHWAAERPLCKPFHCPPVVCMIPVTEILLAWICPVTGHRTCAAAPDASKLHPLFPSASGVRADAPATGDPGRRGASRVRALVRPPVLLIACYVSLDPIHHLRIPPPMDRDAEPAIVRPRRRQTLLGLSVCETGRACTLSQKSPDPCRVEAAMDAQPSVVMGANGSYLSSIAMSPSALLGLGTSLYELLARRRAARRSFSHLHLFGARRLPPWCAVFPKVATATYQVRLCSLEAVRP